MSILNFFCLRSFYHKKQCLVNAYDCWFFFNCMLSCLQWIIKINLYTATVIDSFYINWSDLESWRVTYLKDTILVNLRCCVLTHCDQLRKLRTYSRTIAFSLFHYFPFFLFFFSFLLFLLIRVCIRNVQIFFPKQEL